ncbi:MAG: class I SAM-dependent methyltransferase [Pirellulaceae bacterium]
MLTRQLEPELMDSQDEAMDYDAMDHRQVNDRFVSDLCEFMDWKPDPDFNGESWLDVLDMGTGTAQIPIRLCQHLPQARVMAAEQAIAMLEIAKININIDSMLDRVQLLRSDCKRMEELEDEMFRVVMSNSLIHHLPNPAPAIAEAVRVTEPGGTLFFRDLMRPESEEQVLGLVQAYAGNEGEPAQKMFADSLRAALTLDEVRELVGTHGFAPETVSQSSDRHWTWAAQKPE